MIRSPLNRLIIALFGCFIMFFPGMFLKAEGINLGLMSAQYSRPDVVFFPDGQSFAVASDKLVRVYDLKGNQIRKYQSYLVVKGLAISPDGSQLATAESDDGGNVNGLVKVVDVKTGRLLRQFRHRAGYAEWLSFSPNGRYLASAGDEPAIYVWDLLTGKMAARIDDHTWGNLSSVHFSADGNYLFSGGQYRDNEALRKAKEAEDRYYGKSHSVAEAKRMQEEIARWYEVFNESWRTGEFYVYSTSTWQKIRRITTPGAVHSIQSFKESESVIVATNMDRQVSENNDGYLLRIDPGSGNIEKIQALPSMPDDFAGLDSEHRFYYRHNFLGYYPKSERYILSALDEIQVLDDDLDEIESFSIDSEAIQSPAPAALSPDGKVLVILKYNRQSGLGTAEILNIED